MIMNDKNWQDNLYRNNKKAKKIGRIQRKMERKFPVVDDSSKNDYARHGKALMISS